MTTPTGRPEVSDIRTLEILPPEPPIETCLAKFSGRRTSNTLAAARRMQKRRRTMKIPANLAREAFIMTGGFYPVLVKAGWEGFSASNARYFQVGESPLVVVLMKQNYGNEILGFLLFRGQKIAHLKAGHVPGVSTERNSSIYPFFDQAKTKEVYDNLCQPWDEARAIQLSLGQGRGSRNKRS